MQLLPEADMMYTQTEERSVLMYSEALPTLSEVLRIGPSYTEDLHNVHI